MHHRCLYTLNRYYCTIKLSHMCMQHKHYCDWDELVQYTTRAVNKPANVDFCIEILHKRYKNVEQTINVWQKITSSYIKCNKNSVINHFFVYFLSVWYWEICIKKIKALSKCIQIIFAWMLIYFKFFIHILFLFHLFYYDLRFLQNKKYNIVCNTIHAKDRRP